MKRTLSLFSLLILMLSGHLTYSQTTALRVKLILQAAWQNGDSMTTACADMGMLPTVQPYSESPWNYPGNENVGISTTDLTDWVLLELRSSVDTVVDRKAALLRKDGCVINENGGVDIGFYADPGDYYIVVRHHNHLPVMSLSKYSLPSSTTLDFTDTSAFPVYGHCILSMPDGREAMIAGDINQDGMLKYSGVGNDRAKVFQRLITETGSTAINATTNGYFPEDISMDGTVKYAGMNNDPSRIVQNLIGLTGLTAITATYSGCAPAPVFMPPPFHCGDSLLDNRDGQKYATAHIGTQCWMAQNLNIGTQIDKDQHPTNNGTIEKVCYDNIAAYCDTRGGLYEWNEMMNYNYAAGGQGICPDGWHVPSDAEWKLLEGRVDDQYGIGDPVWDNAGYNGSNVALKLREAGTAHWRTPNAGATDDYGFRLLPTGYKNNPGGTYGIETSTMLWTSDYTNSTYAIARTVYYNYPTINRYDFHFRQYGCAIRCIYNNAFPCNPPVEQANAGMDIINATGDSLLLQANDGINAEGLWQVVNGSGGSFSDSASAQSVFYGQAGMSYTLSWTLSTICGSITDSILVSFQPPPFICGDTLVDSRDSLKYATVLIGSQCWMAENLNHGVWVYDHVTGYEHTHSSDNGIVEKYCINNQTSNCDIYGGFYDWNEAMDYSTASGTKGICPDGWHLPSNLDFDTLEGYVDSLYAIGDPVWNQSLWRGHDAGKKLKSTTGWDSGGNGTDDFGFNALPAGFRRYNGQFQYQGQYAYFWTSDIYDNQHAWRHIYTYNRDDAQKYYGSQYYGFNVRCIKD